MTVDLGDYNDVPARIAEFRTKYPEGSLQPADLSVPYRVEKIGEKTFIVVVAAAYRNPSDTRPGIGMAYELCPGKTPYTKDSELQNAETSAWGRAIVAALAADTKKVASREEVRNRTADRDWDQNPTWDPAEQQAMVDGWTAEIEAADADELKAIGVRMLAAKKNFTLSPASYDHLVTGPGAKRKGELDQLAKEASDESPGDPTSLGVAAADPSPGQSGSGQPEAAAGRRSSR